MRETFTEKQVAAIKELGMRYGTSPLWKNSRYELMVPHAFTRYTVITPTAEPGKDKWTVIVRVQSMDTRRKCLVYTAIDEVTRVIEYSAINWILARERFLDDVRVREEAFRKNTEGPDGGV